MTSEEIAKLAGVSRSTVSRVVNGYSNVPEDTYKKVMKYVKEFDYSPNASARALAGKETGVLGVFVISRKGTYKMSVLHNNAFLGDFLNAIIDVATYNNYCVLTNIVYSNLGECEYSKIKQSFVERRIDFAILLDVDDFGVSYINELVEQNYPICCVDAKKEYFKNNDNQDNFAIVNAANYKGACEVMEYLVELGHKKICFIKGEMVTYSAKERYRAYIDIMNKYGYSIESDYILDGEFSGKRTVDEVKKMISECENIPTAIFASNDDMALAAINTLTDCGYKVPEDISVVGFDNLGISKSLTPKLTTVENPILDIAEETMKILVDMKNRKHTGLKYSELPVKFIIRDSCRKIK